MNSFIKEEFLTRKQKEVLKSTYQTPKGGTLTPLHVVKGSGGEFLYMTHCSLCSEDEEVYPYLFKMRKNDFIKGNFRCGCSKSPKLTNHQNYILMSRFLEIEYPQYKLVKTYKENSRQKFILKCSVCSVDKELWPEGSIKTTKGNLDNGQTPCGCTPSPQWSKDQRAILIQRRCGKVGFVFIGYVGSYRNAFSKIRLKNPETGNVWDTDCHNFLNGKSGDPVLASGGFNKKLPANFYLVRWYGYGESYLKFGITNNSVTSRVKCQYHKSKLDYKILNTFKSESGKIIAEIEKSCKKDLDIRKCPKKWLPDGYTETVEDTEGNRKYFENLFFSLENRENIT